MVSERKSKPRIPEKKKKGKKKGKKRCPRCYANSMVNGWCPCMGMNKSLDINVEEMGQRLVMDTVVIMSLAIRRKRNQRLNVSDDMTEDFEDEEEK